MADGRIKISIEVDGKQVEIASKDLDNLGKSGQDSGKGLKSAEDNVKGLSRESNKASGNIRKIATSLGLVAIGAAAFKVLKESLDDAITRFDILNKFPKVLEALGVGADEAERSTARLADGIDGLPTKLDDITATAQRMYTSFDDMDKATDTALALNNALLGSGSSAEQASRGTEQYLKALQTGHFDLITWRSLSETMDVGLVKIAEGFGYAGRSAKDDLYNALKDGTITLDQFNDKLIEVGTGTGIMAELAKENSLGIATSLDNLKYAAARGIANILESLNKLSIAVTGNDIAENIDGMKHIVMAAFGVIQRVIEGSIPVFKLLGAAIGGVYTVAKPLTPVLIGMASAFAIHMIVNQAASAIKAFQKATILSTAASKLNVTTTTLMTTAQRTLAIATYAAGVAQGVLTGQITLSTAAKIAAAGAAAILRGAIQLMLGPVGWVTAGIGALVGAVVGIVKWFKRTSDEAKRLNAETEELSESTEQLNDAVESSADAYKDNTKDIKANAEANLDLANRIEDLAEKENKSAAEKQLLKDNIDQLNESVEGLNLSYSEEADALNMSSEQLQARIDLMEEQTSYNDALERQVEIEKEMREVEQQLAETNELREEWNQKLEDGSVKSREHKKAIEELDEQEEILNETTANLADQFEDTQEQINESIEAITEATENGVTLQTIAFEDLSEAQQSTVENMKETWEDYKDAATDMFDTLSDEAELTVAQMTENLEENQRIIGEWAEGIATLAERGVDEGLLNTLREAGPESAGHVNALVNASDDELAHLSDVFAEGGNVATDALSKSLGIEESGVLEAVGHLVSDTEKSLKQQIESADFPGVGGDVADGLADGIEGGAPLAEKASSGMAKDTIDAAKSELGIQSPSTVFKGIGTDITEGLVLGVKDGTTMVVQAITEMFDSVQKDSVRSFETITKDYDNAVKNIEKTLNKLPKVTQKSMRDMLTRLRSGASSQVNLMKRHAVNLINPFSRTPAQFNSIGRHAMSGLNMGLNAGRARVMSTARSIANQVASTMQRSLRIHSPSVVMRDEVGRWIPEGLAMGIKANADSVFREIDRLSSGMMAMSTPEMALGLSGMGALGANHSVINNYTNSQSPKNITNNNKPTIHIEKIENYSDSDIPEILEEAAWILGREDKRL